MKLLIAMPCLNEELTVADVINKIPIEIDGIEKKEVIVIDDGSTDMTVESAKSVGATVVSHDSNRGVGVALRTAYNYALENNFDIMVNIDADNQFDPTDIPKIIKPIIEKKADMVTASRFINKSYIPHNMSLVKKYGNIAMAKLISGLCGERFYDVSCGFRAYSKETLLNLNLHGEFTYTQETFLDLTYKGLTIVEIPIIVKYFRDRKSRVAGSIWKYGLRTSNIVFTVYRDYYPMKFFGFISLIFMLVTFFFGGIFLNHFIETGRFVGCLSAGFISVFSFILSLIFFIVGLAMGMLVRIRNNQERILVNIKKNKQRG